MEEKLSDVEQLFSTERSQPGFLEKVKDQLEEIEEDLTCWICFGIFQEPITLQCSHNYCKGCISSILNKNPECAYCRRAFGKPLPAINREIEKYVIRFQNLQMETNNYKEPEEFQGDNVKLIELLPNEIWIEILSHLSANDLAKMRIICKQFKAMCEDGFLWREHCKNRWPFCSVNKYKNWMNCYYTRTNSKDRFISGKPQDFKMITLRGHKSYLTSFDCYRNHIITTSADKTAKLWNVRNEEEEYPSATTLSGHSDTVTSAKFNNSLILTGSLDRTIRLWDANTLNPIAYLQQEFPVRQFELSDEKIFSINGRQVSCWDGKSGTLIEHSRELDNSIHSFSFIDNNTLAIGSSEQTLIFDRRNLLDPVKRLPGSNSFQTSADYLALSLPNSIEVYSVGFENRLLHRFQGISANTMKIERNKLAVGCRNGMIQLFSLQNGNCVGSLTDHTEPVNCLAFRDNYLVSGGADHCCKVWDIHSNVNERLYTLLGGSRQTRGNNQIVHPTLPGCSSLFIDEGRIIASFNNLVRVYSFEDAVPLS